VAALPVSAFAPVDGHALQGCVFWRTALRLFDPTRETYRVAFEAGVPSAAPEGFDDVVCETTFPPETGRRLHLACFSVKYHVRALTTIRAVDLASPTYLGRKDASLLSLVARAVAWAEAQNIDLECHFVTMDSIESGDPLVDLWSGFNGGLRWEWLEKLHELREEFRSAAGVEDDEGLAALLAHLHLELNVGPLTAVYGKLRGQLSAVGFEAPTDHASMVSLAQSARRDGDEWFDQARVVERARRAGLWRGVAPTQAAPVFLVRAREPRGAVEPSTDRMLDLLPAFDGEPLRSERSWHADVFVPLRTFVEETIRPSGSLATVHPDRYTTALALGRLLPPKSGVAAFPLQLTADGRAEVWRPSTAVSVTGLLNADEISLGDGPAVAVAFSVSRRIEADVERHLRAHHHDVGTLLCISSSTPAGGASIRDADHAWSVADELAQKIDAIANTTKSVHLFAACPTSVLFFAGQRSLFWPALTMHEFVVGTGGARTYTPTLTFGPDGRDARDATVWPRRAIV
jgi:hypothetical protein